MFLFMKSDIFFIVEIRSAIVNPKVKLSEFIPASCWKNNAFKTSI